MKTTSFLAFLHLKSPGSQPLIDHIRPWSGNFIQEEYFQCVLDNIDTDPYRPLTLYDLCKRWFFLLNCLIPFEGITFLCNKCYQGNHAFSITKVFFSGNDSSHAWIVLYPNRHKHHTFFYVEVQCITCIKNRSTYQAMLALKYSQSFLYGRYHRPRQGRQVHDV